MRAYLGPLLLALAGWLGLGGCSSGQTGSPDCVGSMSCICDPLYIHGTLLRVTADSFESGRLEATVQQAFTSADAAPSDILEGDRVGGLLDGEQPCDYDAPSAVDAGVELLVLYVAGSNGDYPNCSDFHACANADCSGLEASALSDCWNSCKTQTAQVCADHRSAALLDGYFRWAVPWQEPLDFGASHQLSTDEIDVLTSTDACFERFPAPPAPPCNDTSSTMRCASPPRSPGGDHTSSFLLAACALWALRRTTMVPSAGEKSPRPPRPPRPPRI